jgi:hypothetical protein
MLRSHLDQGQAKGTLADTGEPGCEADVGVLEDRERGASGETKAKISRALADLKRTAASGTTQDGVEDVAIASRRARPAKPGGRSRGPIRPSGGSGGVVGSAAGNRQGGQSKGAHRRPVGGERAQSKRPRVGIGGGTQPPFSQGPDMMGVLKTGAEAGSGIVSPEDRQQHEDHLLQSFSRMMNIKPKVLKEFIEEHRALNQG